MRSGYATQGEPLRHPAQREARAARHTTQSCAVSSRLRVACNAMQGCGHEAAQLGQGKEEAVRRGSPWGARARVPCGAHYRTSGPPNERAGARAAKLWVACQSHQPRGALGRYMYPAGTVPVGFPVW